MEKQATLFSLILICMNILMGKSTTSTDCDILNEFLNESKKSGKINIYLVLERPPGPHVTLFIFVKITWGKTAF